jgi:6-phosphogluconolactonase
MSSLQTFENATALSQAAGAEFVALAMAAIAARGRFTVAPSPVHRMRGEDPDLDRAARDYQLTIARRFGVDVEGPPPALDLSLLGMGPDGHTASLFPASPALKERRRWVVRNHAARLGADRITLTAPILNEGRDIRPLVTGADKAGTLKAVLEGPADPERLPVQLMAPTSGRLRWLLDRAAAAALKVGA